MTPEATEADEDARNFTPYDIDGYEWEKVSGADIEPGMLIPGHGEDVWEVREQAGFTLDMAKHYHITVMVDDGTYSHMPDFNPNRADCNEAMRERVSAEPFHSEKEYWTLTETGGDEA